MVYALFAKKVWKQAFIYFYTAEFHGRFGPESWSVCARVLISVSLRKGPCLFVIVMGSSVGRVMFWVCSVKGEFGLVVFVSGWGVVLLIGSFLGNGQLF